MVVETPEPEFEVKAQVQLRHFLERYSHFVSHIEYIIISTTHILGCTVQVIQHASGQ